MEAADRRRIGAMVLAVALGAASQAAAKAPEPHTPSGLPIPRYVSLKFDNVNARAGPSDDHRLLWVYHAHGLPVQVIAETEDWRRVCDPDGQVGWVHRRTTDGRRTVMRTKPGPVPIQSSPRPGSGVVAYLAPRALASLDKCKNNWCRISVGRVTGWAAASSLWGVDDAPQCR